MTTYDSEPVKSNHSSEPLSPKPNKLALINHRGKSFLQLLQIKSIIARRSSLITECCYEGQLVRVQLITSGDSNILESN
jgi:hypothetical protein